MDEGGDGLKDRLSSRGTDALGDLAQALADNPLFNQALQVAMDARERVNEAGAHAMKNLNVPTAADVERLGRRLRVVSERLEAVEDKLDQLSDDLIALRRLAEREDEPSSRG
jgi:hypothetical protein